jgi:hypothetical protein
MKVEIKESLKIGERAFKAPVLVYENYAEMLKDAGSEQAIVDKVNGWLHAHGSAAILRDLIVESVEEASGVKPIITKTGKKNAKGVELTKQEDPMPFVLRVIGAKPELFDKVQTLVDKKAKGYTYKDEQGVEQKVEALAVDISTRPPSQRGPGKLADKWKQVALSFINGTKSLDKFNKALSSSGLATFTLDKTVPKDDPKNVEGLGRLCKAYQDSQDAFKSM